MSIRNVAAALGLCLLLSACGGGSSDPAGDALVSARKASALRAPPISPQRAAPARAWHAPTMAEMEALFSWAQGAHPEFFGGGQWTAGSTQGYTFRHYRSTGGYLAVKEDGGVWVLGPFTDDELTYIAPLSAFACQMYPADCGRPDPVDTGPHVTSGNVHDLLMTWTSESQQGMIEKWEHNVSTGATGALIFRDRAAVCSYEVHPDGNVTYTSHGSTARYTYEGERGATDTTGALRARLYMHGNTADGQGITSSYVDVVRGHGLRSVSGTGWEEWCVSPLSLEDTTLRFPLVDGRLAGLAGTWTGELAAPILFDSSVSLPPAIKQRASCSATIDVVGSVTVSIAGYQLPSFYTYDTHMSQERISTMFTGNAVLHPQSTFALSWNTSGWASWLSGQEVAVFSVYAAPLNYWDAADPSFTSPALVTCRAMRS